MSAEPLATKGKAFSTERRRMRLEKNPLIGRAAAAHPSGMRFFSFFFPPLSLSTHDNSLLAKEKNLSPQNLFFFFALS